ncbi:hypothetical protein, partial [Nitratireductor sp. ZSWI3]|uniref:hypothetical protein n=1 Tax=Nitratireductor sp. ZSWI3 TaxID=2966359 RepID=UPI002150395A
LQKVFSMKKLIGRTSGLAMFLSFSAFIVHAAPTGSALSWPEEKCRLFKAFKEDALARLGREGFSASFLETQERFIAEGCTMRLAVCPQAPKELDYANLVSLQMINAGATGSFLPFSCPRR